MKLSFREISQLLKFLEPLRGKVMLLTQVFLTPKSYSFLSAASQVLVTDKGFWGTFVIW